MKKIAVCLFIVLAFISLSCRTAPRTSGAVIEGDVTQEKIDDALEQIYETYRGRLDLTGAQSYVVVRGDSLSQIARRFFGSLTNVGEAGVNNGFYFPVIMLASPDSHIVDPDLIEPGLALNIPDLQRNLANSSARRAIKDFLFEIAYIYNRKDRPAEEEGLRRLADSL